MVTGGAGYLGSTLVGKLVNEGYSVRVLDFLMFGRKSLDTFRKRDNFELVVGDIRDKSKVKRSLENVWAVCHLASLIGEPACADNPKKSIEINLNATQLLVSLVKKYKIERFIFPSTCSIYGNTDRVVDESFRVKPISLYAETKRKAERVILRAASAEFCPIIFRLGTCFGLSPKMNFNLLINQMTRDLALGKRFEIYKPYGWRPFIHVEDVAVCFINILSERKDKVCGEVFNLVGENLRRIDVVNIFQKHFPKGEIMIVESNKDTTKRDYKVSSKKIRQRLGYTFKRSVDKEILVMKNAFKQGIFKNPYHWKYNTWVKESML